VCAGGSLSLALEMLERWKRARRAGQTRSTSRPSPVQLSEAGDQPVLITPEVCVGSRCMVCCVRRRPNSGSNTFQHFQHFPAPTKDLQ